jgi:hypothetical protein
MDGMVATTTFTIEDFERLPAEMAKTAERSSPSRNMISWATLMVPISASAVMRSVTC